ncbi:uncharacterized protein A4U43_C05F13490 [Asparagus officinalis]|uniref:RRM domain-containing protein n=1 Tax=Asparagus officinalis TaxID=4686 RepID=A0A5P1ERY3_ASPOF|nr:uncharacterized protein A4U43_C05F13490 [Asparagus officinalis]
MLDPSTVLQKGANQDSPPNRILFVAIYTMLYPITEEVLQQVFSPYGFVEEIVILQKSAGFQALIQFQSQQNAVEAMNSLQGRNIYDGIPKAKAKNIVAAQDDKNRRPFGDIGNVVGARPAVVEGKPLHQMSRSSSSSSSKMSKNFMAPTISASSKVIVPPERQKIMLKGGLLKDDADWLTLGVKDGQKLMMMGTTKDKKKPQSSRLHRKPKLKKRPWPISSKRKPKLKNLLWPISNKKKKIFKKTKLYALNGSPKAQVFSAVPPEGISRAELEEKVGGLVAYADASSNPPVESP